MVLFSCTGLSKSFAEGPLFEDVSFGMESGDRVGLIGRNGVGKTTLLRVVAGMEQADTGEVAFNAAARIAYLEQAPRLTEAGSVLEAVMAAQPDALALLDRHAELCRLLPRATGEELPALQRDLDDVTHAIEHAQAWSLESEARKCLQRLGVDTFDAPPATLSGGQRKRVALARALLMNPDLLILDEPTNHLDADSVQWLQDRLQESGTSLLLITHDRYFLDSVVNRIVELDGRRLFSYPGSYESYLERREAAVSARDAAAERDRARLRRELAWLQRGAPARRTKQKSRVDWIARMEEAPRPEEEKRIRIEVGSSFLGSRVIDAVNIGFAVGERRLFHQFTHIAAAGDRLGVIGPNGCGKSTLLRVLAGEQQPHEGTVKLGESVRIGFFRQEDTDLDPGQSVLGCIKEIAEYIDTGVGRDRYLSATDMLLKFQFPRRQQLALMGTLSGGERRRISLIRTLMGNPNVLFLDEPTNDFDIPTLTALEEYLSHFLGFLVVVSHDRAFLDRTVEYIYAFEEGGVIRQYPGNYSAYLLRKEGRDAAPGDAQTGVVSKSKAERSRSTPRRPLSWKEERERSALEEEIAGLERERAALEEHMADAAGHDRNAIVEMGRRHAELGDLIEAAMLRWMELEEKGAGTDS
jgi:ABC transport system ATP-binding/permease protein